MHIALLRLRAARDARGECTCAPELTRRQRAALDGGHEAHCRFSPARASELGARGHARGALRGRVTCTEPPQSPHRPHRALPPPHLSLTRREIELEEARIARARARHPIARSDDDIALIPSWAYRLAARVHAGGAHRELREVSSAARERIQRAAELASSTDAGQASTIAVGLVLYWLSTRARGRCGQATTIAGLFAQQLAGLTRRRDGRPYSASWLTHCSHVGRRYHAQPEPEQPEQPEPEPEQQPEPEPEPEVELLAALESAAERAERALIPVPHVGPEPDASTPPHASGSGPEPDRQHTGPRGGQWGDPHEHQCGALRCLELCGVLRSWVPHPVGLPVWMLGTAGYPGCCYRVSSELLDSAAPKREHPS